MEASAKNEFTPKSTHVTRRVRAKLQDQMHEGKKHKIQIEATPLPDVSRAKPHPAKGIEQVIALVMHPKIRIAATGEAIEEFDPPIEFEVEYTRSDVKATQKNARGTPKLSLSIGYEEPDGEWKWEKLKTRVKPLDENKGTLHAKLRTLHPKDPMFITRP